MREWINIVNENRDYPLYHGTSLPGLFGIISEDSLYEDGREETHGASLTYSIEVAEEFAESISRVITEEGNDHLEVVLSKVGERENLCGAIIEFSSSALRQKFELQDFHSPSVTDGVTEEEVRILLPAESHAHPIKFAITGILMPIPQELDMFIDHLGNDAEAYYGNTIAFIRSHLR